MEEFHYEIIRATVTSILLTIVWWYGTKERISDQSGWYFIIIGLGLILFGTMVDATKNFRFFQQLYIVEGKNYQPFLEIVVGGVFGYFFLVIGFWMWTPTIVALREAQLEIKKVNEELESRVQRRTKELNATNKNLESTISELHKTRDELLNNEKMASLGRLVSGFAHEINTPIGVAITGASSLDEVAKEVQGMLEKEEVDVEKLEDLLTHSVEASAVTLSNLNRAANLVKSFKRTSIDQTSDIHRTFSVKEAIDDVLNSLHNKFKRTAIEIEVYSTEDHDLYGYPGAFDQVITNLLMNSYGHAFNQGTLPGKITIKTKIEGESININYTDTGKGMDSESLSKMFEPFYTTGRDHGGSGLGMYICYNLVTNRFGGKINCESSPGKGVKFSIILPMKSKKIGEKHHLG